MRDIDAALPHVPTETLRADLLNAYRRSGVLAWTADARAAANILVAAAADEEIQERMERRVYKLGIAEGHKRLRSLAQLAVAAAEGTQKAGGSSHPSGDNDPGGGADIARRIEKPLGQIAALLAANPNPQDQPSTGPLDPDPVTIIGNQLLRPANQAGRVDPEQWATVIEALHTLHARLQTTPRLLETSPGRRGADCLAAQHAAFPAVKDDDGLLHVVHAVAWDTGHPLTRHAEPVAAWSLIRGPARRALDDEFTNAIRGSYRAALAEVDEHMRRPVSWWITQQSWHDDEPVQDAEVNLEDGSVGAAAYLVFRAVLSGISIDLKQLSADGRPVAVTGGTPN